MARSLLLGYAESSLLLSPFEYPTPPSRLAHASLIMTESEFQTVENLLGACAANVKHSRKIVTCSAALVSRARKLIEFSEENLRSKSAWTSKKPIAHALGRVSFFVGAPTKTVKSNDAEPTGLNP